MKSYRSDILTFCGSSVDVKFDINGPEGKNSFRIYDNGRFTEKSVTRHPNILRCVIIGKKSWGLWVNEWSDGIVEGSFTKSEILEEFSKHNITIPESLLKDFENRIINKIKKKYG